MYVCICVYLILKMLGQENKGLEKISQTFLKQIIHKLNCKLGYVLYIHVYNE